MVSLPIAFLSLFDYYAPTEALASGHADAMSLTILIGVGTVAAACGLATFIQRDFPA